MIMWRKKMTAWIQLKKKNEKKRYHYVERAREGCHDNFLPKKKKNDKRRKNNGLKTKYRKYSIRNIDARNRHEHARVRECTYLLIHIRRHTLYKGREQRRQTGNWVGSQLIERKARWEATAPSPSCGRNVSEEPLTRCRLIWNRPDNDTVSVTHCTIYY